MPFNTLCSSSLAKFATRSPNAYPSPLYQSLCRSFPTQSVPTPASLNHALNLFDEMSRTRPLPSLRQFSTLLSSVVKMKEYSAAISLFKHMLRLRMPVNDYTMSIAINSYCSSGLTNCGFSLLTRFFKLGHVPDAYTFSTLLSGLFREEPISEAQCLFDKIVRQSLCEMDVVLYGCVVDGLCKAGNTALAIQLVKVMKMVELFQMHICIACLFMVCVWMACWIPPCNFLMKCPVKAPLPMWSPTIL